MRFSRQHQSAPRPRRRAVVHLAQMGQFVRHHVVDGRTEMEIAAASAGGPSHRREALPSGFGRAPDAPQGRTPAVARKGVAPSKCRSARLLQPRLDGIGIHYRGGCSPRPQLAHAIRAYLGQLSPTARGSRVAAPVALPRRADWRHRAIDSGGLQVSAAVTLFAQLAQDPRPTSSQRRSGRCHHAPPSGEH